MDGVKFVLVKGDTELFLQEVEFTGDQETSERNIVHVPLADFARIMDPVMTLFQQFSLDMQPEVFARIMEIALQAPTHERFELLQLNKQQTAPVVPVLHKREKVFLDMEMTELSRDARIISIGLVSESGYTFYAESTDFDAANVNPWIKEHVLANLILGDWEADAVRADEKATTIRGCLLRIGSELRGWLHAIGEVEIWSDCLAYDWMLFNDLFINALQLKDFLPNVYYIPFDLCTRFRERGIDPDVSREKFAGMSDHADKKHNALFDAQVIKRCWEKCEELPYVILAPREVAQMRELLAIQGQDGAYNDSLYMLGLYHGLEMMMAVVEKREPVYRSETVVRNPSREALALMKLRAEFDYLWKFYGRDQGITLPTERPEESYEGASYFSLILNRICIFRNGSWENWATDGHMHKAAMRDRMAEYSVALETLILNRLDESGLNREQFGADGVAGLIDRGVLVPNPSPYTTDVPEEGIVGHHNAPLQREDAAPPETPKNLPFGHESLEISKFSK